jgi:hypothetical protein
MQEICSPFRDRSQSPVKEEGWALNPVQAKRNRLMTDEEELPQNLRSYIFDDNHDT